MMPRSSVSMRRTKVDATVHGFRSAFRDWAGERTAFPREVAEAALAHLVGDQTERAYRRGDALEKRRALMDAWQTFCFGNPCKPALSNSCLKIFCTASAFAQCVRAKPTAVNSCSESCPIAVAGKKGSARVLRHEWRPQRGKFLQLVPPHNFRRSPERQRNRFIQRPMRRL
jgi:hypothetical protein